MNTILITGVCEFCQITGKINYDVNIWASKEGHQIQLVTSVEILLDNYSDLWKMAKQKVMSYFKDNTKFDDGAYTQYLDHLTIV